MAMDFIIPARDEELTVRAVVEAAQPVARAVGGKVLVISDNCHDATAAEADKGGAEVLVLGGGGSSKSKAVVAGLELVEAKAVCLLDADCVGLRSENVADLVQPVLDGTALMSVGTFDYGPWSWVVESIPWSTGQRALPTDLFPVGDPRLEHYAMEILLNEAVGRRGGTTVSMTMSGVHHRSKVAKAGLAKGLLANLRMWIDIAAVSAEVDPEAYRRYADNVLVPHDGRWAPAPKAVTSLGVRALQNAGSLVRRSRPAA